MITEEVLAEFGRLLDVAGEPICAKLVEKDGKVVDAPVTVGGVDADELPYDEQDALGRLTVLALDNILELWTLAKLGFMAKKLLGGESGRLVLGRLSDAEGEEHSGDYLVVEALVEEVKSVSERAAAKAAAQE